MGPQLGSVMCEYFQALASRLFTTFKDMLTRSLKVVDMATHVGLLERCANGYLSNLWQSVCKAIGMQFAGRLLYFRANGEVRLLNRHVIYASHIGRTLNLEWNPHTYTFGNL